MDIQRKLNKIKEMANDILEEVQELEAELKKENPHIALSQKVDLDPGIQDELKDLYKGFAG